MQLSRFDPCEPPVPLLGAYTDYIGGQIDDWQGSLLRNRNGSNIYGASVMIGQACFQASIGEEDIALSLLHRARNILPGETDLPIAAAEIEAGDSELLDRCRTVVMKHATGLTALSIAIENRRDPKAIRHFRHGERTRTTRSLQIVSKLLRDEHDDRLLLLDMVPEDEQDAQPFGIGQLIGLAAEQTGLGLLNRSLQPNAMAIAALPHHDSVIPEGAKVSGYDLLAIRSDPGQPEYQPTRAQIKNGCLGYCVQVQQGNERLQRTIAARQDLVRSRYLSSTVLISGHCDLGMRYDPSRSLRIPVTDMLVREAGGRANRAERERLDWYSRRLWQVIASDDPARRGLVELESVAERAS